MLVVVDEAYLEFVRMADPVDGPALLRDHPNVVLLRTFSKAYGLAGLRVGYAVATADVAGALRAVSLPFGVSSVAQAAAVASLAHEVELLARVDALVGERDRLVAGIAAAGWSIPEPQGNFVWFDLGDADRRPGRGRGRRRARGASVRGRGAAGQRRRAGGHRPAGRAAAAASSPPPDRPRASGWLRLAQP